MKKSLLLGLGLAAAAASATAAPSLVEALSACDTTFYEALAKDKKIPEALKVRKDNLAFLKLKGEELQEIPFKKTFRDNGLTITGFIVSDAIERFFGVPDMHNHFWGFTVKEDWMGVVEKLRLDWEAIDTNHKAAHFGMKARENGGTEWKVYVRPQDRDMPEFGRAEKAFHVSPYKDGAMIFCSLQSAGAPDEFGLTGFVEQSFAKVFTEGPDSALWKANKEFMWPYAPHYEAYATNLAAGDRDAALGLVRSCATAHRSQQAALYTTMCRQATWMLGENPPSFFDIMSLVIEQHLKSALSRLGFRASWRYSHSDMI